MPSWGLKDVEKVESAFKSQQIKCLPRYFFNKIHALFSNNIKQ